MPETVHVDSVVEARVTVSPLDAVAVREEGVCSMVSEVGGLKVIVWVAFDTVITLVVDAAE